MQRGTCKQCRYWNRGKEDMVCAQCRIRSPVVLVIEYEHPANRDINTFWPWTKAEDWCGEFEETGN